MNGFHLAACCNILGILLFNRFFQSDTLGMPFPELFGRWGQACIILWGLAYWAVAANYRQVPALVRVFCLEKLVYVASWLYWLVARGSMLPDLWLSHPWTAVFYASYGLLDFSFALFFWRSSRETGKSPNNG